ncbi:hypothetical protein EON66_04835 [archaeon]|nr:MAG: hypothetical protein EON66_04835 [archaeon]
MGAHREGRAKWIAERTAEIEARVIKVARARMDEAESRRAVDAVKLSGGLHSPTRAAAADGAAFQQQPHRIAPLSVTSPHAVPASRTPSPSRTFLPEGASMDDCVSPRFGALVASNLSLADTLYSSASMPALTASRMMSVPDPAFTTAVSRRQVVPSGLSPASKRVGTTGITGSTSLASMPPPAAVMGRDMARLKLAPTPGEQRHPSVRLTYLHDPNLISMLLSDAVVGDGGDHTSAGNAEASSTDFTVPPSDLSVSRSASPTPASSPFAQSTFVTLDSFSPTRLHHGDEGPASAARNVLTHLAADDQHVRHASGARDGCAPDGVADSRMEEHASSLWTLGADEDVHDMLPEHIDWSVFEELGITREPSS